MRSALIYAAFATAFVGSAPLLWAEDVWDLAGGDDVFTSDNELVPGSVQVHDMEATGGTPDEDWFRLTQKPYSSYQIVVDGMTAGLWPGLNSGLRVDIMAGATNEIAYGTGYGVSGAARVLYARNEAALPVENWQVRVHSPKCDTTCESHEQYTIHLHDTTYAVPRFNNAGGQVTILVVQNASDRAVGTYAMFFNAAGTLLARHEVGIPSHGTLVLNTGTLPEVGGASGSIIVLNDGHYGALSGKAVALEPATGFTFDTLMVGRPQ